MIATHHWAGAGARDLPLQPEGLESWRDFLVSRDTTPTGEMESQMPQGLNFLLQKTTMVVSAPLLLGIKFY
jgi:hypothetical protein